MAVRVRETGNMGAVSEMMDDDQRDDGRTGGLPETEREGGKEEEGGEILAAWKLEANPNPSNPRMDPT